MQSKQKAKALVLLSGGLDSRLALMMMKQQLGSKNVEALHFILPFGEGCCSDRFCVFGFAQKQHIRLHFADCTKGRLLTDYMKILRAPKHGRGAALNPCIDCRIFMFKKTKKIAKELKADIIVTGEVAGERPMSQKKKTLRLIESRAGLKGKILRPLSAKILPETGAEKKGLIDRSRLEAIEGRQRKRQMELARKFGITYPNPAGGCLLCEKEFCKKVAPLLRLKRKLDEFDIAMAKVGRHFESSGIVLGKNKQENEQIAMLAKTHKKGFLIIPGKPGPAAFIRKRSYKNMAEELIRKYSKHKITYFHTLSS
ncbi:MAG: tRNA 4-thiouridine(8) synthase ThiI [Candidatus Omnitrophica bacterium]|nr:tRNA 4-thiouridine(8) synthase ThiI [Candidatus Omnitrophota bacterium]